MPSSLMKVVQLFWLVRCVTAGDCIVGNDCIHQQTSLVQVRSQQGQVLTHEEMSASVASSSRKTTLSHFQKFANEMVSRVVEYNTSLSQDDIDNINIIISMIEGFYDEFVVENSSLLSNVKVNCEKTFEACHEAFHHSLLNTKYNEMINLNDSHTNCRGNESVACGVASSACQIYDSYRTTNASALYPVCAATNFTEDIMKLDETLEPGRTKVPRMEECLDELNVWLDGLYPKYIACDRGDLDCDSNSSSCNATQEDLEGKVCEYAGVHDIQCGSLETCWGTSTTTCQNFCDSDSFKVSIESRKADNETGERVKCLLNVLLAGNADKTSDLTACVEQNYNFGQYWDVRCPQSPLETYADKSASFPASPLDSCSEAPIDRPCDEQWSADNYAHQSWFSSEIRFDSCKNNCSLAV